MTILPETIYGCNAIVIKIPILSSPKQKTTILKFIWNHEKSRIAKSILRKISKGSKEGRRERSAVITIHDLKTCDKAIVSKYDISVVLA
jgi:hypothetical protein